MTGQEVGGEEAFAGWKLGECNGCCILYKVTAVVGNITFYKRNKWACNGDSGSIFHM